MAYITAATCPQCKNPVALTRLDDVTHDVSDTDFEGNPMPKLETAYIFACRYCDHRGKIEAEDLNHESPTNT
jgi:hypothetical protein